MNKNLEYRKIKRLRSVSNIIKNIPRPLRRILFYDDIIVSATDSSAETLLDVGGGESKLMSAISKKLKKSYRVNADIFLPYLKFSKAKGYYGDCVLCDVHFLPFKKNFLI